ncbi:MAG: 1-deoxy-D-xylulose-5-phosphate reductoisomerase [Actinomycetia bacterium]|nr:1-deoxy-D-xylulose-5-phosphate reductoisomerase [Actinomycetes bacterium]
MTTVALLGSTGSIGTQAVDVVAAEEDRFEIVAIGAGSSVGPLAAQARKLRPKVVAIADESGASELRSELPAGTELLVGPDAMAEAAVVADVAVNGVVGFAGLSVTLEVLRAGKRLALANKESLIAAGPIVQPLRETPGAELIPVDSEHAAVHMCLRAGEGTRRLHKVVLTASGGPFLGRSRSDLEQVTVQEALAHPTWSMGPKITVDSSTLMNKGLEVIEAHELFGVGYDDIDVVVHPQSIVHSMATFSDGATIAQLSLPDMRLPIAYALAYPDRTGTPFGEIDFGEAFSLDFEPPDRNSFGCLSLAYRAGREGGTAPAWLSAANEEVVEGFLEGRIAWIDIASVLASVMDHWPGVAAATLQDVMEADAGGRRVARELLEAGVKA